MIYSRRYSRNFVPLKQDNQKHNLDFRPSLGRCVIEIKDNKGKITLYAQGINPKNDYYLELIGFEKGHIKNASLGKFNVDSYGKGEFSVYFDPDNIQNNKIEDFNVISVMVKEDNDISSALVGYTENEIDWEDSYRQKAIINIPREDCGCIEKPEDDKENEDNNNNQDKEENDKTELEQGLIDKEEGLLEREKGLIDREKGLTNREENNIKLPLDEYEKNLKNKLDNLAEKEKGLAEREQGLLEKERALREGFLPTDDKEIREKELELIKKEMELIKIEQELINRERNLIRTNPTSDRERGLIEKEKGILEREQGLLEREKGLIEKEKGLLEIEKGIREKNKYTKKDVEEKTSHETFKEMLNNIKRNMLNIENFKTEEKGNKNVNYIKNNNAIMTPFVNSDENIKWYRISPYELTSLTEDSHKYSNNPFVFTSYKKYKHLILGVDTSKEEESYILAIPCRYEKDFSISSLEKFLPIDNGVSIQNIDNGEYGYRIVKL